MKKYRYSAVDLEKHRFSGVFYAEDEESLRRLLAEQNLFLTRARPVDADTPNAFWSVTGKVSVRELTVYCRQLATMLEVGISILDASRMLCTQEGFSGFFRRVLRMVQEDLETGLLLSEAMAKHEKIFPQFFCSMVKVGELSGSLEQVLRSLAEYCEREAQTRQKVRGALTYPLLLLCMLVGVLALLFLFVVPNFQRALTELDVAMPPLTLAMFRLSGFLMEYWRYLLLFLLSVVLFFMGLVRTDRGKTFLDGLKLRLPVFRRVQQNLLSARFARSFGLLLSGGMDMNAAMDTARDVLGNLDAEKRFDRVSEGVRQGASLTAACGREGLFPPVLLQMLDVGERTGELDQALLQSCKYFDEQAETALNTLTTLLQPAMLLIMGIIIALVFLSVYSPILSIIETIL